MPSPEPIYKGFVRAFSVLFIGLGVTLVVVTLLAGGGPLSLGFLMGLAFGAVGAGRLWAAARLEK
jgi:hypothetical protein